MIIIIQNGIMTRLESMIARTMNNPSVVIDNISNVTIIPSEDKYFFLLRCKVLFIFWLYILYQLRENLVLL